MRSFGAGGTVKKSCNPEDLNVVFLDWVFRENGTNGRHGKKSDVWDVSEK